MNPIIKRTGTYVLKLLVSAAAIYYVLNHVPFDELGYIFRHTDFFMFFLAAMLYLGSQAISTIRLNELLKPRNINIPFLTNFKLYLVGMSYNLFLPGGVGGDGYKIVWIGRKYHKSKRRILTSVFLDRLSGLLAIGLLLLLLIPAEYVPGKFYIFSILLFPVMLVAFFFVLRYFFPKYKEVYYPVITWAVIVQMLQVFSVMLLARAVHSSMNLTDLSFIFLVSSVATAIPVFLGGLGAREMVFGLLAVGLGINQEYAVSIALLFSAITVIWSLPGLFLDWKMKIR